MRNPAGDTGGIGTEAAAELERRLREATLGEYDILARLGVGGMASVFLAHDLSLDRRVAIKVMSPAMFYGQGLVERFRQEARTAAALSHPNIIPVYAVREVEGLLFFVMKVIEGTSLDAIIDEMGPMPIAMVAAILAQVGGALGYAHRHGVVHRDIKPANILLDEEGWVVVTDFGIAKVTEANSLTLTGMSVGTPTYMSPEQCGGGEITGATDQYSLGVVTYEMLVGKPPFTDASVPALMVGHATKAPPPIARADCPARLLAAVERMLAKDPAERFESMEAAVASAEAGPLSLDDPTRDTLVALARNGSTRSLISQIQTPRSPVPMVHRSGGQAKGVAAHSNRRLFRYAAALAGLGAVVALAAIALRQPGQQDSTGANDTLTATSATAAVPTIGSEGSAKAGEPAPPALTSSRAETDQGEKRVQPPAPPPPPPAPATAGAAASTPALGPPDSNRAKDTLVKVIPNDGNRDTAAKQSVKDDARPIAAATPPPPPPPPAAAVAPDPVVAIRRVVQGYAAALESGQLDRAVALFPTMPTDQREGLRAFLHDGSTMTTNWQIGSIAVNDDQATLEISGTTTIHTADGARNIQTVSLRATLRKGAQGWRLSRLENR